MKPLPQTLLKNPRVQHLEYIFQPPGLPLVEKVPGEAHATSILVRGKAGTGKSTLAMALALDIADIHAGRVLYLSTEIAPVDIAWKLRHLKIPPEKLAWWQNATAEQQVLAQHLGVYADIEIEVPEERMGAALEKLWELVQAPPEGAPLRAVVVDAFSLVGAHPRPEMRGKMLNLLQHLENMGISTILVEEAPAPAADWTSFLVDVVFELSWGEDPDTGKMYRRLGCIKSRFVQSIPGPHGYGMEGDLVAVWPPLWSYVVATEGSRQAEPILLLRSLDEKSIIPVKASDIVASRLGVANGNLSNVIAKSPWMDTAKIDFGTFTRIQWDVVIPSHEGPESIGWAILREIQSGKNVILVQKLPSLLHRRRFAVSLPEVIENLASSGAMVVIHEKANAFDTIPVPITHSFGPEGLYRGALPLPRHERLNRALLHVPEFNRLLPVELRTALSVGEHRHFRSIWPGPTSTCLAVASGNLLWALKEIEKAILAGTSTDFDELAWVGLHAKLLHLPAAVGHLEAISDPKLSSFALLFRLLGLNRLNDVARVNKQLRSLYPAEDGSLQSRIDCALSVDRLTPKKLQYSLTTIKKHLQSDLPPLYRAEILLDLAVLMTRLGKLDEARTHLAEAQRVLPTLEPDEPELEAAGLLPPSKD